MSYSLLVILFLLALTPWIILSHEAMNTCLVNHSHATCINTLR